MKSQSLFSGKNKKNTNLLSAEFAQGVVKVKKYYIYIVYIVCSHQKFHANVSWRN